MKLTAKCCYERQMKEVWCSQEATIVALCASLLRSTWRFGGYIAHGGKQTLERDNVSRLAGTSECRDTGEAVACLMLTRGKELSASPLYILTE